MRPAAEGGHSEDGWVVAMSEGVLRRTVGLVSGIALLNLSACYSGPEPKVGLAVTQPIAEQGQAPYSSYPSETYELRPNDVINVQVFREPDLTVGSIPVSATGDISLPLLGQLQVAGMTAPQLETQVQQMLNDKYLRDPHVTVNVLQYGSHQVTVEGSVTSPGMYNFTPGTRLSGAMALAKGPSRVADQRDIAIFRQTPDGIAIAKFDLLANESGTMMDPVLEPGDRVVVGLNNLSQFWQDVLMTLPVFAWFRRF